MGASNSPPKGIVQSVTAVGLSVLRSVNLLGAEKPAGVRWKSKDPRKEYKFGSELGHGNYGVVHLVTHTQSGRVYACKILRKQSKLNQQHIMTEIEALHHVDSHPNIATLHEVWDYSGYLYLILEACLGGELFDVIMHRGHFTEKDAAVVTRVILDVVAHCHKRGVAHRDLKPENFLLKRKALEKDKPLRAEDLRLVDFGLATFLQPTEDSVELLGSPFYIAPEVLKGCYGFPADVWSAGVILYILLSGLPPFSGNNEKEIFRRTLRQPLDLLSDPWPTISASAKDLVAKLLERDSRKRLKPSDGLHHAWLRSSVSESAHQSQLVLHRLRAFTEVTKLQGLLMNIIAKNMSVGGIDALQAVFDQLDTNDDGYLSFEELQKGMEDAGSESETCNEAAKAVMAALDVSGDGFIEYHEFLAAVLDRQQILTDQTIAEMFSLLDKNNDGHISAEELRLALAEAGIVMDETALKQLMLDSSCYVAHGKATEEPRLTRESFAALLQGSLQQSTVKLAQLEGALSGLQQSFRMRNRFKQLAMLVIARNTPVSELQGLRELFQKLDIDNSGCLTLDELRRGLKLMDSELSDDEIEELLEFMDVDGNQMVDYHEFVMGTLEDKQLLTEAKLRVAFDYFDEDRNGYIDIGEVEKVVTDLGIKMQQSPVELLAGADNNDDSVVDFEEFRTMMLSAEPNALTNKQESLASKSASPPSSSRTSRSSRSFERNLGQSQPCRDCPGLDGRLATVPQGTLEFAVQENLFGGGSAVAAIRKEFPNEANTGKRDPKSPAKGPIKHAKGGMPKYENRSNQMPGKPRQEGSRLTSDGAGNSKAGALSKKGRSVSLFTPCTTGSELLPACRSQSLMTGSKTQEFPRRRRQHIFINNSQHAWEDAEALDPVDIQDTLAKALSSWRDTQQCGEPKLILKQEPSKRLSTPSEACDKILPPATSLMTESVPSANAAAETSVPARAHLKSMLHLMEEQWSRTSILTKRKSSAGPLC